MVKAGFIQMGLTFFAQECAASFFFSLKARDVFFVATKLVKTNLAILKSYKLVKISYQGGFFVQVEKLPS